MVDRKKSRPALGAGDVVIVLGQGDDAEEMVLRPTYRAAKTLSTKYNGLSSVIERVLRLDFEIVVDVIGIGLGYTSTKRPPEDLAERVFHTGLTDDTGGLAERCVTFLHALAGGGRLPDKSEEEDGESPLES
jgi:hypothetical protein